MRRVVLVVWAVVAVSLMGCAGNREVVLKAAAQTRQDVFQVALTSQAIPEKALLSIELPVKTFKARFVNSYFKHSDPPYTVVVNIDGQSIELTDEPVLEDLPGNPENNPEVGRGWRYTFKAKLHLSTGNHKIIIAIPESDVAIERDVTLVEGENLLKMHPIYRASSFQKTKYQKFGNGIQGFLVSLN